MIRPRRTKPLVPPAAGRPWPLVLVLGMALAGCTAAPPAPGAGTARAPADLGCTLPSNCVSSADGGLPPLAYTGSADQAMARLRATLASYPEATVLRSDGLQLTVVFTTPAGFRDEVDFRVDPAHQHIDFRSRSLLGLFDFGKNRSRMRDFAVRFGPKTSQ